jgi:predicted nucleotidyltransferase
MNCMNKHSLSLEKRQEIIQRIVLHLENEQPELLAAYIFGSFVTDKPFADIDLALFVGSRVIDALSFELITENKIEHLLRVPVDVRVMDNAPLSFQYQVIHDGKRIINRSPNVIADYEGQILKQYFEISRFRRRYLKEVVHAAL